MVMLRHACSETLSSGLVTDLFGLSLPTTLLYSTVFATISDCYLGGYTARAEWNTVFEKFRMDESTALCHVDERRSLLTI